MRKFWIAMLAAMLLVLLPVASLAAVWVAGVEMAEGQYLPVGSSSLQDEKPAEVGYALLTKENGQAVLTLHDYHNYGKINDSISSYYSSAISLDEALILHLEGSSTLINPEESSDGISVDNSSLTITGDGSLKIDAPYGIYKYSSGSVTIAGGNMTLENATAAITTDNFSIKDGSVSIKNCTRTIATITCTISGGNLTIDSSTNGIRTTTMTMNGGSVSVNIAGSSEGSGIFANNLTINNGSVSVTSSDSGFGILTDNLTINNGSVSVTNGSGIVANFATVINGGSVSIKNANNGISTRKTTITGGTVAINAKTFGISSSEKVEIYGGILNLTAETPVQSNNEIICKLPLPQGTEIFKNYVFDGSYHWVLANKEIFENDMPHTVCLSVPPAPAAAPTTGDNAQPVMWLALAVLSALCAVTLMRSKRELQQK